MKDLESELIGSARLPTRYGEFTAHAFQGVDTGTEHLALRWAIWPAKTCSCGCIPNA
jgi:hypothetical protein